MKIDFETDLRFCTDCRGYMPYLQSLSGTFCMECGEPVRLSSPTGVLHVRRSTRLVEDPDEGRSDELTDACLF
jgi:hypothetical protein